MEEHADLERLALAKGRERLKSLVENGTMSQAEADTEYVQVMARMRAGGITHALAFGTHRPAAMDADADRALNDCSCHPEDWCTCGALRRAEERRARRPPPEEADTGSTSPRWSPAAQSPCVSAYEQGPTQLGPRSPNHEPHSLYPAPHPPQPRTDREENLREDQQLTSSDTSSKVGEGV